jgi:hypothetical protein
VLWPAEFVRVKSAGKFVLWHIPQCILDHNDGTSYGMIAVLSSMQPTMQNKSHPSSNSPSPAGSGHCAMSKSAECVKVILRCRPMNKKEESDRRQRIVDMDTKNGVVRVRNPKSGEHPQEFTFDAVFDWNCVQPDVYDITARPIVESVLDGFNGTVFAYGQTGTGKTWTMEGSRDNQELKGVIPRTFDHIFESIGSISDKNFRAPLIGFHTPPHPGARCRRSAA